MPNPDFVEFDTEDQAKAYLEKQSAAPYGRKVIEEIYPGVEVTSDYRGPNHPLSRKNPKSFHTNADKAVDIRRIPGMSFESFLQGINDKGYDIIESRDEYTNPSKNATGPHWHVVLGDRHDVTPGFDTEEEALKYIEDQKAKASAPAPQEQPHVPYEPRTFDQNVPVGIEKSTGAPGYLPKTGEVVGPTDTMPKDQVANLDQMKAQQNDIQNLLWNNSKTSTFEDLVDIIEKRYPGQVQAERKNLQYYYNLYRNGDKTKITWTAAKNDAKDPNEITGPDITVEARKKAPYQEELEFFRDRAEASATRSLMGQAWRARRLGGQADPDVVAETERVHREALDRAIQDSPLSGTVGGEIGGFVADVIGGIDPTYAAPPFVGETLAARLMSAPLIGAASDAALQGVDIATGVEDGFDVNRNLLSAGAGLAFQGVAEGLGRLAKTHGVDVQTEADGRPYVDVPTKTEGVVRVYDPALPISKKAQLRASTAQPAVQAPPGVRLPVSNDFRAKANVESAIAELTASWKAAPEFTVHQRFDDLPDTQKLQILKDTDGHPEDVKAFVDSEGKIQVISDNLDGPEDVSALTYHEALGHVGLQKTLGTRLDSILNDAYRTNPNLRQEVDNWFAEGGQIPDDVSSPVGRATEEVLAERSETGPFDVGTWDKIKNLVKTLARRAGMKNLAYSDREIKTILGMAHSSVINGGRNRFVGSSGNSYIRRVTHVSPHDFKNVSEEHPYGEFDHSRMGSGEGNQVYGWGTYLGENTRDSYFGKFSNEISPAKTYEVDIHPHQEERMLHWDKKIYDQPPAVQKALKRLGFESKSREEIDVLKSRMDDATDDVNFFWEDNIRKIEDDVTKSLGGMFSADPDFQKKFKGALRANPEYQNNLKELRRLEKVLKDAEDEFEAAKPWTGEGVYKTMAAKAKLRKGLRHPEDAYEDVSKTLLAEGIIGNKYEDGFSRHSDGSKSYNFVVFDEKQAKIINKYMRRKRFERASVVRQKTAESRTPEKVQKDAADLAGNINLDRLDSTEEIDAVIRLVSKEIPKTSVTHDEIRAAAEDLGMTERQVRDYATENGGARLLAMRRILVRSSERVMKLARAIDSGDNSDINRALFARYMATHRSIQEKVSQATAEAGRTLNALKIMAKNENTGLEALRFMANKTGAEILGNPKNIDALASRLVEHADNPAAATKIMKNVFEPFPEDYLISFRYNMMLYNLGTHVVNAVGNTGSTYLDLVDRGFASILGQIKRPFSNDRVSAREVYAKHMGLLQALVARKTWRDAGQSYVEGHPLHQVSKVEVGANLFTKKMGPVGQAIEVPSRALAASDSFSRSLIEQASFNGLAHRKALSEGLTGDAYTQRVSDLLQEPTHEMKVSADTEAAILQLVDEPSWIGKSVEKFKQHPTRDNYGLRFLRMGLHLFVPFSRVTDRLFWGAVRRIPLVGMLDHVNQADFRAGGARRDVVFGRMITGSIIIGILYQKYKDGELSGNEPENYRASKQKQSGGWQPNSIKFGDTWYPLRGLDQVMPLANMVASFGDTFKDKEFQDQDSIDQGLSLIATAANSMASNTFVQQIADTFGMLGRSGLAESKREAMIPNLVTSFIPSGVKHATELADGSVRDSSGNGELSDKIVGRIKASLPGLREDLPESRDVYGRVTKTKKNILTIGQSSTEDNDPVIREVDRLTEINDGKALVPPVTRSDLEKSLGVKKIDAEIVQTYQEVAGKYTYESLKEYMGTPEWASSTDEEKIKLIKKIGEAQRKFAREDLFEKGDN